MKRISRLPKKVDWVALCEMYKEYMEEISDHFYKLLQVQLKKDKTMIVQNEKIEAIRDELDTAISVFHDINEFITEEELDCASKGIEVDPEEKILKYISDRIDGLTEMCPILYSLSHDSAKENAEAD